MENKKQAGQQPYEKTTEAAATVSALATFGVNQEDICTFIGVSLPTLHKYFRQELDESAAKGKAAVTKFLFHAASGKALDDGAAYADCLRAAMFYAKTRMGWRETQNLNHKSEDGSMSTKASTDPEVAAAIAKAMMKEI